MSKAINPDTSPGIITLHIRYICPLYSNERLPYYYFGSWKLADSTLTICILFFKEMLNFFNFVVFSNNKINCEGKYRVFKNILFVKNKISKLINHSINM
jgi:hypothetical protein